MIAYGSFQKNIYTSTVKIPGSTGSLIIRPFGDVHRDSHNCDVNRWKAWLDYCKNNDNDKSVYLGMGDYNDFASYSERKMLDCLHESTCEKMDKWAMRDVEQLASELEFMRGKIIGLHHGNHEWKFMDGELATEKLCKMLGCNFLGFVGYTRIKQPMRGTNVTLDIFSTHGKGGSGKLLGSTVNNVEKLASIYPVADIYLMGHDHRRGSIPRTRLVETHFFNTKQLEQHFGRTGSFLKGWVEGNNSYVASNLWSPTSLGTISYKVQFDRCSKKNKDTIIYSISSIC